MDALGMVEIYGFTTAICCADIAAKSASVKIIALDTNKPANGDEAEVPLVMVVKMEGSVSAVTAGVKAAKEHAEEKGLYITSHIISRPGIDVEKMAYLSNIGRDRQPVWSTEDKVQGTMKKEEKKPKVVEEKMEVPVPKETVVEAILQETVEKKTEVPLVQQAMKKKVEDVVDNSQVTLG